MSEYCTIKALDTNDKNLASVSMESRFIRKQRGDVISMYLLRLYQLLNLKKNLNKVNSFKVTFNENYSR